MDDSFETRLLAVRQKLEGKDVTSICKALQMSRPWFYKWFKRFIEEGEDGLKSHSKAPHTIKNKTHSDVEEEVVKVRKLLQDHNLPESKYAPIGADNIQWELERNLMPFDKIPSIATINRIIKRNDLIQTPKKLIKHSLPYPAPIANVPNAVHQLDTVGPRYLQGSNGTERFYCLNLIDCFSRITCSKISERTTGTSILHFLLHDVWPVIGIPQILQVDNMLAVRGSNKYPRSFGAVIKWCLFLGIEVLFIPVKEPQRNGYVEKSNDKFDKKFYRVQQFESITQLVEEYQKYQTAMNVRYSHPQLSKAIHGARTPYEVHFMHEVNLLDSARAQQTINKLPLTEGKVSFIRFIKKDCKLNIFSESFDLPAEYKYNYVTATIHIKSEILTVTDCKSNMHEFEYLLNKM